MKTINHLKQDQPDLTEYHLEPERSDSIPYANRDQARRGLPDQSDFYFSLEAGWQSSFHPTSRCWQDFHLPSGWESKQVFAHFQRVESAIGVWVNDQWAGSALGGNKRAEFNITNALQPGQNRIEVEFSSGVNCNPAIHLWAVAAIHLRDFRITTLPGDDASWEIVIQPVMRNLGTKLALNHRIETMLFDARGIPVWIGPLGVMVSIEAGAEISAAFSYRLKKARPWSPEDPYLYTLILEMRDADGTLLDLRSARVGFGQRT